MSEVNKRQNGPAVLPECVWRWSAAVFCTKFVFAKIAAGNVKHCTNLRGGSRRGIAIPLLSLRVRVHRERGSRNTLSLCDSLHTFCSHRKYAHGVTGSSILQKVISKSAASLGRTPAPAVYLYMCCLYTDGVTPSMRLNTAIKLLMFMYPASSAICVMLLFVSRSSSFASATLRRFM